MGPLHSFMLDLNDPNVEKLFYKDDWEEITSDLPSQALYSEDTEIYMDKFVGVKSVLDLEELLKERPMDPECQVIHYCLDQWLDLYKTTDPSPFSIIHSLGESWWMQNAWGASRKLAHGVPHSFIIPGEKATLDSVDRINKNMAPTDHKRIGPKADLLWRTMIAPEQDWGAAEAACEWDPLGDKYRYESTHKLPRQLHDILVGRTYDVDLTECLRKEFVT
ncbi:hypothetical protein BGX27_002587, partial [Mortierella sp. AM989]